ncbi:MAG: hypothetical protein MHPSP_001526 [Paramarteilia canceri]
MDQINEMANKDTQTSQHDGLLYFTMLYRSNLARFLDSMLFDCNSKTLESDLDCIGDIFEECILCLVSGMENFDSISSVYYEFGMEQVKFSIKR